MKTYHVLVHLLDLLLHGQNAVLLACNRDLVLHHAQRRDIDPHIGSVPDDLPGHLSIGSVDEGVVGLGDAQDLVGLLGLLVRNGSDLVEGLLDAFLGAGDGDGVDALALLGNGDLRGGFRFQILKFHAALAEDEAMVFFRDSDGLVQKGIISPEPATRRIASLFLRNPEHLSHRRRRQLGLAVPLADGVAPGRSDGCGSRQGREQVIVGFGRLVRLRGSVARRGRLNGGTLVGERLVLAVGATVHNGRGGWLRVVDFGSDSYTLSGGVHVLAGVVAVKLLQGSERNNGLCGVGQQLAGVSCLDETYNWREHNEMFVLSP
ncbi:hypothetical protein TCAL_17047 [Tigriopus californicus]|uniref:Secreted protein n=1 Tax=Tigriopus californicus TaxID=6832 RepID=A0A553PNH1_TIGCA|nr:hypothetical protein TCAL_17047 [Tigriopus californicus]